jgi:hypothetical protein
MNLTCPHCHQPLAVADQLAGQKVACPRCKRSLLASPSPAAQAGETPAPAPLASLASEATASAEPAPAATSPTEPENEPLPPAAALVTTIPEQMAYAPQQQGGSSSRPRLVLRLDPGPVRWVLLASYLLLVVLLFSPWVRVLLPPLLSPAERRPVMRNLVLIVGLSSSMNERIPSDEVKVQTVKRVLSEWIDRIPAHLRVAMLMYGHDRVSPCQVTVVRKLDTLNPDSRAQLKQALQEAEAVGLAPLAGALEQAGAELATDRASAGVLLITDGLDTCDGDPVAQAATLANHPELEHGVYLVGYGAVPQELRGLRVVATAGKGRFSDTQTAEELSAALNAMVSEIRESLDREAFLSALGPARQSGLRIAFGEDPIAASPLTMSYFFLVLSGLFAALTLLALPLAVPRLFPGKISLVPLMMRWLTLSLAGISLAALLVLLVTMIRGFPVESDYHTSLFTARTIWLSLTLVLAIVAVLIAGLLVWLQRRVPDRATPRVVVEW